MIAHKVNLPSSQLEAETDKMNHTQLTIVTLLAPLLLLGGCSSSNDDADQSGSAILQDDDIGSGLATGGSDSTTDDSDGSGDGPGFSTGSDSDSDASTDGDTAQLPQSDLDRLIDAIQQSAALPIEALNRKLHSGETLTTEENACLGAYDPGTGNPVFAIDCANGLIVKEPLQVQHVEFAPTESCRISLGKDSAENCELQSANLSILTVWVVPEVPQDDGYVPARPYPIAGIDIAFRQNGGNTVVLQNATSALTGVFRCEVDLQSGAEIPSDLPGDCPSLIVDTTDRLRDILDAPAA